MGLEGSLLIALELVRGESAVINNGIVQSVKTPFKNIATDKYCSWMLRYTNLFKINSMYIYHLVLTDGFIGWYWQFITY